MSRSVHLLSLLVLLLSPACAWSVDPVLPPVAPPPNVPADVLLFTVPDALFTSLASPSVVAHFAVERERPDRLSTARVEQVARHEVRTGMTARQAVWAFGSHPSGIVDQGPPGGHTLLWAQGAPFAAGRFWVRLDEWGRVVAAGRY